jgi:hypothetical protein
MPARKKDDIPLVSEYTFEELRLIAEIGGLIEKSPLRSDQVEKVLAVHEQLIKKLIDEAW